MLPTESNNKGDTPTLLCHYQTEPYDVAPCRLVHVSSPQQIGGEFLAVNAGLSTSTGPLAHNFSFESYNMVQIVTGYLLWPVPNTPCNLPISQYKSMQTFPIFITPLSYSDSVTLENFHFLYFQILFFRPCRSTKLLLEAMRNSANQGRSRRP